jgi:deoxyribonuclease V
MTARIPQSAPAPFPGVHPVLASRWDLTVAKARQVQEELRVRVRATRLPRARLEWVAGCDVAIAGDRLVAAVVLLHWPDLEPGPSAAAEGPLRFPYVPGLLSFREIPVLLEAFASLSHRPGAILCDGQGRAHPRRIGLASHLGVLLDLPTVGCAKSRLIGEHEEPGPGRGNQAPLRDGDEVIGAVLRTRDGVKPLYISVGHKVTLPDAVRLVLECGGGYRLPEPTRLADQLVGRLARERARRCYTLPSDHR